MITIEAARTLVAAQKVQKRITRKPLVDALGFCVSQPIISPIDLPLFDNSAMDGYAVNGVGKEYELIGEIAAGDHADFELREGEAVRIFTGAKVPLGATTVVMQEKVTVSDGNLILNEEVSIGKNIRKRGEELAKGALVFEEGQYLNAASIGMLTSLGFTEVEVYENPKIAILTTGNELVKAGEVLEDGQIYESNSITIVSAIKETGFSVASVVSVKDDFEVINQAVAELLSVHDLVLISGGISVGDYDFVREALHKNNVSEIFYKVNQKPGKPLFFGRKEEAFVFALPGNPGSALNCFYVYVRLLLSQWSKRVKAQPKQAQLSHDYKVNGARPVFLRAQCDDQEVSILEKQSSAMLHSFAMGNAVVLLDGGEHRKGEEAEVWLY